MPIDLDAAAERARAATRARSAEALPRGAARGRRRLSAHARHDQLRLGLVPDRCASGPGCSGYFTVAWSLADHFRAHGPWSNAELRALDAAERRRRARPGAERHPLMRLYAEALRDLGRFLGERSALDLVEQAAAPPSGSPALLARGMRFFDDRGFYKRAQIVPSDLALAGVAEFDDLDRLTIFADNLVPHVLRVDGVLRYDRGAGRAHRRGRAAAARLGRARDPRLRAARLRAARERTGSSAAGARRRGSGTAGRRPVQGDPAPPDAQRLLLKSTAPCLGP